jgi:hypothetical protein
MKKVAKKGYAKTGVSSKGKPKGAKAPKKMC